MAQAGGTSYGGNGPCETSPHRKGLETRMKRSALLAGVLALGLGLGLTGGWIASGQAQPKAAPAPAVTPPPSAAAATGSFAKLAEAVKPAVINVSTQSKASGGRTPLEEFYGEDFFKRFFGDAPEKMPRRTRTSSRARARSRSSPSTAASTRRRSSAPTRRRTWRSFSSTAAPRRSPSSASEIPTKRRSVTGSSRSARRSGCRPR